MHFQVRVGVFNLSTNLDKGLIFFLCWDARTGNFHQLQKAINIMCFFHIVKLYTAKIKYTRSFDNSNNKIDPFHVRENVSKLEDKTKEI